MFRKPSEDKIFKREARLFLEDLNPPRVITTNISSWRPFGLQERTLKEVYQWLKDLNSTMNLGLRIEREGDTITVYKDGEVFAYFIYYETKDQVKKYQDFRTLLSYIDKKLSERPLKTLSKVEEMFYQEISEFLGMQWDDPKQRKIIIEKWKFFVSPIISRVKFRNKDEVTDFLVIIEFEKLKLKDLNTLLNYINALNITNYKPLLFDIFACFFRELPFELLLELEKIIERKNLDPPELLSLFNYSIRGELGKYSEVKKIFVEFLKGVQKKSDLEVWRDVITYNPNDLEFIKETLGLDWSGLFKLLSGLSKDEDLRRRFHRAVKIRSRRVMEEVYSEVVGRKLVGRFRGFRTKSSNLTVVKLILDNTKRKFLNEKTAI